MIRRDQIDRLAEIIKQAAAAGNTEALHKATHLLGEIAREIASVQATVVNPYRPDPMTRAHAREDDGLHQLRKGRDRCTATRRDGQPCRAPAVAGHIVCRRHGGGAPQVKIAARHMRLLVARYTAHCEWEEARGTPTEFDALCRALEAGRQVETFELKIAFAAELRAAIKARQAITQPPPGRDP